MKLKKEEKEETENGRGIKANERGKRGSLKRKEMKLQRKKNMKLKTNGESDET